MDVPSLVQSSLGDEDVAAHVSLKGEDALFVTPTRSLLYTDDGLLSDESVSEYPHDAEAIRVSDGRRKATISLDYGLDGDDSFSVPSGSLDDVLHPILAGVLNAADVTEAGETVRRSYRFSELTLVVTSNRVVKHVGSAVWGLDFEEIVFETVTGLSTEDGNVSSQLVLETTQRTERIKAPNDKFRAVREAVEDAVFAYHDVTSAAELAAANSPEQTDSGGGEVSFGSGVDPIDTSTVGEDDAPAAGANAAQQAGAAGAMERAGGTDDTEPAGNRNARGAKRGVQATTDDAEFESSGFQTAAANVEPAVDPDELAAELADMTAVVDEFADTIDKQHAVIDDFADTIDQQRAVIDAQQAVLDEQRERLDDLQALIPDQ
ncbi:DUF7115 domain-containing protein [Halobacterium salinarum]|uniref:DUF7115 domain-containing protein n=4 Tax=Halobacterium salinarum TaxID=2242 RepID=Q9HPH2_HALSA|nr:hypothetical protein [Halobacterium salinarum]AAG19895.1 hypothetical protein VNG_1638H [Halobacterium salinarum NRC-1]MBB6088902.1 putative coiled-coil protein SlyX [Halobacterium salinarum]MDL0121046.1 hypothetical protein [Halobacterium salinarum]MDL0125386.1 hypothetical protein [Halobacterium salinarum]MDL0136264.1 hypothetical protein [Halobacterium salinarum]